MKPNNLENGIEIVKQCQNELAEGDRLRMELTVFRPNQSVIDMLLTKAYLQLSFNSETPDDDILIFHDSEDKYSHNGTIRIICYLSQTPEVLEHTRKHKKVAALIKKLEKSKRKGGDINC